MTERCTDLDEFFDGELAADQADAFRDHLATCERCQRVLHGRMQESVAARVSIPRAAPAPSAPAVAEPAAARPVPAAEVAVVPIAQARRGFGRALAYAAPALAAAAAVQLWLGRSHDTEFKLSLDIDRAKVTRRGTSAHVGDVLRPKVLGERHRAIWVYLGDRRLLITCPRDVRCISANDELTLELPLTARGAYAIVGLGSGDALPEPGATLDDTLAAARRAGIRTQVEYIDVD